MPILSRAVDVTTEPKTGATTKETLQDMALISHAQSANAPPGGFNAAIRHSDPALVAQDFGEDSDLHQAAQAAKQLGVESFVCIVLEAVEQTEVISGSDTSVTSTGMVTSVPIAGDYPVTVTVDTTAMTTVYDTTTTPPALDGEGASYSENTGYVWGGGGTQTLGADEALVNRDTGEVKTGTDTSGTGAGIEVTYTTLSWTDGLIALKGAGVDLTRLANTKCDIAHLGELDELSTWGGGAEAMALNDYKQVTDPETGRDMAHAIGKYIGSPDAAMIATESPDDTSSMVLGDYATHEAWYDPYPNAYPASLSSNRYARLVGEPGQPGTFEGGDAGAGPANVIYRANGGSVRLSNTLTTAGLDSPYRYIDVRRTETFLKNEARLAIINLLSNEDQVGYNHYGRGEILAALNDRLQQYAGGPDTPCNYIRVDVPEAFELSQDTRAERIWNNIDIETQLSGNMHRAEIDLHISV